MTAFLRSVFKALLAATLTATVLIFIFAYAAYISPDPSRFAGILGMAAFFLSCLIGGIVSRRGGNILSSLVFGLVFVSACLALSLVFQSQRSIGTRLLTCLGGLASSVAGGMIFGGKKSKKPKSLKKYIKQKK